VGRSTHHALLPLNAERSVYKTAEGVGAPGLYGAGRRDESMLERDAVVLET
jgi:hypothetical protein